MTAFREGFLKIEHRDLGDGIIAYGVDGYPTDCVLFALYGLMKDNPPDLVISGINSGANFAMDWIFFGTIAAARLASYLELPSIAVSGMDENIPDALNTATNWVVQLDQSDIVKDLKQYQFLTVSLPIVPPSEIKGVRIVERAGWVMVEFVKMENDTIDSIQNIWEFYVTPIQDKSTSPRDVTYYFSGYIVIVPMYANEHDYQLLLYLKENKDLIPEWTSTDN